MNTQKTQTSTNVKGFTLVELIVVITILAILGTIAFLSLQGQSAAARDSKRKTDLSSITTKLTITQAGGSSILSLITPVTGAVGTAGTLSGISIGGTGGLVGSTYQAGTPNFTAFGMNAKEFMDADGVNTYKIGGTTLAGSAFQLAATLENDASGNAGKNAFVTGNYVARGITLGDTNAGTGVATTTSIVVNDLDVGKFKTNDFLAAIVVGGGTTAACGTGKITAVSSDLKTLSVTCATAGNVAPTALKLAAAESAGLISNILNTTGAVTNLSATALPY